VIPSQELNFLRCLRNTLSELSYLSITPVFLERDRSLLKRLTPRLMGMKTVAKREDGKMVRDVDSTGDQQKTDRVARSDC
jgi:hypothetical protein